MQTQLLTTKELAELLNVSVETVRRMIRGGRISAVQTTENGPYRLDWTTVQRELARRRTGP